MKNKQLLLVLFISLFTVLFASNNVVIRFQQPDADIINKFLNTNYDVAAYKPGIFLDLVVTYEENNNLLEQGYDITITQTEQQLKNNLRDNADLDGYRNYDELLAELQLIETTYPDICKLYDIGDTWGMIYSGNGISNYDDYVHEVWALKVSDNVEIEEDEPGVYYLAAHHSREPISLEVTMTIINHILDNYGTDPEITDNVNNQQVWFVPLVNPNGHKVVIDEQNVWWRKNIFDNDENEIINVTGNYANDGVDPNRNYGWEWGGASANWTSETYQGTQAFSELETQAVRDFFADHHFIAGLTYHSYGELILYPYGYTEGAMAPDQAALSELCTDMALSIPGQNGGFYTPEAGWELYPATGTTDDYAYGEHGIFEYTVELATEFIPPANEIDDICADNLEAAMILLDRSSHSIMRGHVTDSTTGEPLVATNFVYGIDDSGDYRKPYNSNEEFGAYYRLLTDGNYSVTFSAYGYDSQTFDDVVINDDITTIDVALVPSSNTIDVTGVVTDGDTGAPIANATVDILEFDVPAVTTNEFGEYLIEGLFEYNYSFAVYSPTHAGILEQHFITNANNEQHFLLYGMPNGTFEDGTYASSWVFSGNNDWVIDDATVYNGNYSARSGTIYDDQISALALSMYVINDDEISFYQKVSSEANYDYLRFYIDGVLQDSWSGNGNWEMETFEVEAGFHTFEWEYYKDGGVSSYQDCAWIDDITFPTASLIVTPTILEFLDEPSLNGLDFSIINNSDESIIINDIEDSGGAGFVWFINDFNLTLPYTLSAGEQLDFTVMIDFPVENLNRDIVSDILDISTEVGDYEVEIWFDTSFYSSAGLDISNINKFYGNYPNPFNPITTFSYNLAEGSKVDLVIFNVRGQKIKTLVQEEQPAGSHQVVWNGTDNNGKKVSSGIYFSHIGINSENGDYTSVKKVLLLK